MKISIDPNRFRAGNRVWSDGGTSPNLCHFAMFGGNAWFGEIGREISPCCEIRCYGLAAVIVLSIWAVSLQSFGMLLYFRWRMDVTGVLDVARGSRPTWRNLEPETFCTVQGFDASRLFQSEFSSKCISGSWRRCDATGAGLEPVMERSGWSWRRSWILFLDKRRWDPQASFASLSTLPVTPKTFPSHCIVKCWTMSLMMWQHGLRTESVGLNFIAVEPTASFSN